MVLFSSFIEQLTPNEIFEKPIHDIPVRLLQAAGNIAISRLTAFLEHIFKPVAKNYSQSTVNEYCKDSKHYLIELEEWKNENENITVRFSNSALYIIAADVQGLYTNIKRTLLMKALEKALQEHTNYDKEVRKILMWLTDLCLKNVIIQYQNKFYNQKDGIITVDNHSVSLANIALHYIVCQVSTEVEHTEIFKRFIDDIVWLSFGNQATQNIKTKLSETFAKYDLTLKYRDINTTEENDELEFLDILHKISPHSQFRFITTDYVKPTALDRCFIQGSSHHPATVFKSIVFGESVRLRRLNERAEDYCSSLQPLKKKAIQAQYPKPMVEDMIAKAKTWTNRFKSPTTNKSQKPEPIVWTTSFKNLIKLLKKEKELQPHSMVTYKKPPCLASLLLNFRSLSVNIDKPNKGGSSGPCGHCALCGNHGQHWNSMVMPTTIIKTDNETIKLKQNLTCRNYGIYAAECTICDAKYIGQTKTKFSIRWRAHRTNWNKQNSIFDNDQSALLKHYLNYHLNDLNQNNIFSFKYRVIFLQQPEAALLDFYEDFWWHRVKPSINIQPMITPTIR